MFPRIFRQFIHESIALEKDSWLLRFTEGKSGVQFIHRTMTYVVGLLLLLFLKSKKYSLTSQQKNGLNSFILLVFIQFTLGCFNFTGLTHQIVVFILLTAMN